MPEPTTDPRVFALAKARQQIGHDAYGSTAQWSSLSPDEQRIFLEEAATWLRAAVTAGIAPPAAEQPAAETCGKCEKPFGPTDRRTRVAGRPKTAYCRSCVDHCNSVVANNDDHLCVICA